MQIDDATREALLRRPFHRLASGLEVVDLYGSVGHGYMMALDGRVFEWELDAEDKEVLDPVGIHKALTLGARVVPELSRFIPPRPAEASDCGVCRGSGYERLGPDLKWLCGTCGGLGWSERAG